MQSQYCIVFQALINFVPCSSSFYESLHINLVTSVKFVYSGDNSVYIRRWLRLYFLAMDSFTFVEGFNLTRCNDNSTENSLLCKIDHKELNYLLNCFKN